MENFKGKTDFQVPLFYFYYSVLNIGYLASTMKDLRIAQTCWASIQISSLASVIFMKMTSNILGICLFIFLSLFLSE